MVKGTTASGNKGDGIRAFERSQIIDCTADSNGDPTGNTGSGISGGIRTVVRHSSATNNRKSGIVVLGESLVVENRASFNGRGGAAAGIDTSGGSGSRIEGNAVRDNSGTGILATSGDIVIRNSAGNNSVTNYNPSTGTNFAPIQSPGSATNPLANIQF
jgi:hypothetical protein